MSSGPKPELSLQSSAILQMIAEGNGYEQILAAYPGLTYVDIFCAAEDALEIIEKWPEPRDPGQPFAQARARHLRAYEKWSDAEDIQLQELVRSGATVAQIAGRLQRNRGAIRSRIMRLNLVSELAPKEQNRLHRIVPRGQPQ